MPRNKCCPKCGGDHAPFWNAAKDCWSIVVESPDGKRLNRMMTKGWNGHDLAVQNWKRGRIPGAKPKLPPRPVDGWEMTLTELCDRYLDWLQVRRIGERPTSPKLLAETRAMVKDLCSEMGGFTLGDFRTGGTARIKTWAESHQTWGLGQRALTYRRVKAIFNWAASSTDNEDAQDIIPYSPIKKLNTGSKRIASPPREAILSPEQEQAILAAIDPHRGQAFRRAFMVLLGTGMRPEEFCTVTANDVRTDEHGQQYLLVNHKNQHKTRWNGRQRPVRLIGPELQAVVREQAKKHPSGPLFRNSWGEPYSKGSLLDAFRRITKRTECEELGLDEYTLVRGKRLYRYVIYTLRHTFGHRCLKGWYKKNGQRFCMSYAETADLMGNTAGEVERTYGHISQAAAELVAGLS